MNKMAKNITTIMLAASIILLTFFVGPITVSAENAQEIVAEGTWGGIDWTLSAEGTLTVVPTDKEITDVKHGNTSALYERGQIPCGANLAWSVYYTPWTKSDVKSLVIADGITSIGTFAFYDYPNLQGELIIPSSVTYIGQEAIKSTKLTKLIFASGGTEALTIAQGGLNNNLNLEEVVFPADRPEIHLKAWVLNNCDSLTHLFLPANIKSMGGTNYLDYKNFSTAHSAGNHSALTYYCDKLEAITFGSEEVKTLFFDTWGNPITTIGTKSSYTTPAKAAFVGLTYCTSLDAAFKYAEPDEEVSLMKNITVPQGESVEIPDGITLNMAEKTIINNGTILNHGKITGLGEISNNTEGVLLTARNSVEDSITVTGNILECTVTLDYGETNIPSEPVQTINGYIASELPNPDFAGYVFLGWYADADFTTEFDFAQFITTDTTIYVKLGDYEGDKDALNAAIDAVKNDLQSEIDNVNVELNDKANVGDLTDAVSSLNTAIARAKVALNAAIKAVQQNLVDAKNELQNAINANDIDLEDKVANLKAALDSSKAALEVADAANRSELITKIEEANATLEAAIELLQNKVEELKVQLEKESSENKAALEDKDNKIANLQTFVIIVSVISGVAFCGSGTLAVFYFNDKKKR